MELTNAHLVYFSPTSTSRKVCEAIAKGVNATHITSTDVTLFDAGEVCIPPHTLTIIAVPVYGGRVAPLALQRLRNIRGTDTPVVLVVVYGNRAYEKALMELDAFAIKQGFNVIAAATFIGEHSYHSVKYPIAPGRPDAQDLLFAEEFGRDIAKKIVEATDQTQLYAVDVRTIKRPKQSIIGLLRFLRGIMKMRKQQTPAPKSPVVDETLCTHCGVCAKKCPTGAISAKEAHQTATEKCIRCCACIKNCGVGARTFNSPYAPLLSKNFPKQKQPQTLL